MGLMRLRGLLLVLVGVVVLCLPAGASAASGHNLLFSFNGGETPAGSFGDANGVAVDEATGDMYVADIANNVVDKFTATGVYVSQVTGAGSPAGVFAFANPAAVAVDNSTNPLDTSVGDVYVLDSGHNVVDRFDSAGVYQGQLKETSGGPFAGVPLYGVAVDGEGNVWVYQSSAEVDEFASSGGFVTSFSTGFGASPGFAVDMLGDVFFARGTPFTEEETSTGTDLGEVDACGCTVAIATDKSNDVYVDDGSYVAEYDSARSLGSQFGSSQLTASGEGGIAVDSATGNIYVANPADGRVYVFDTVPLPDATTGAASNAQGASATLNGTVDPHGVQVTSCSFEYGTELSYGQSVPCAQTLAEIGSGSGPVLVSADVSGLEPLTAYHFRLVAANANGAESGADRTFYTSTAPIIQGESSSDIGLVDAPVSAQVNAAGLPSTYHVEYGTTNAYGSSTPETSIGAPQGAVGVQVDLTGLQPGTPYHFRVVASNALGTTQGADAAFTTVQSSGASGSSLPDGRAYELVSPVSNLDVNVPAGGAGEAFEDFGTPYVFRASAEGNAVAYVAEPPASGGTGAIGAGLGNEWLAARGASGWSASDIELPHPAGAAAEQNLYDAFSSDLSVGFVGSPNQPPLTAEAPANCDVLYARSSSGGGYRAIFNSTQTPGNCGRPVFAGASADGSHVVFQTNAALIPGAVQAAGGGKENLYDSVGGQVHLVNVLGEGIPDPNATFGSPRPSPGQPAAASNQPDFSNVVSADGSRVFWTDLNTGDLYVRLNDAQPQSPVGAGGVCTVAGDACTVQVDVAEPGCLAEGKCVSGGGRFWTASSDGSKVFFTDCNRLTSDSTAISSGGCSYEESGAGEGIVLTGNDLYEYDVNSGQLTDLTVDGNAGDLLGADVQGVVAVNEAGEPGTYLYFVANGVLSVAANAEGRQPVEGQRNLYLRHAGVTSFVGTLASHDNALLGTNVGEFGDWRADPGFRTAEATPDGRSLVFRSTQRLTGYDNSTLNRTEPGEPVPEVFVYDAGTGRVSCASCNPSGASPTKNGQELTPDYDVFVPVSFHSTFMPRWISADGSSVFFGSYEPLLAQDSNGRLDVYEWKRGGAGGCEQSGGCLYLLSDGMSPDSSYLVDASVSGSDVFFTSRARLVPQDVNENMVLYDARVGGGLPQVSPPVCTGAGCQGAPPPAPVLAVPSSATFSGVGNFAAPPPPVVKPRVKPRRCGRGFVKKHGVCVRKKAGKSAKGSGKRSKKGRKR
jgi:hypothetical protein